MDTVIAQKHMQAARGYCEALSQRLNNDAHSLDMITIAKRLENNLILLDSARSNITSAINALNEVRATETRVVLNDKPGLPI